MAAGKPPTGRSGICGSWRRPRRAAAGTRPRARSRRRRRAKLDDGIEVYNVEGAGGTLGLSQLVSKDSGDPYQLMMTGLVMLGAIETNGSDVDRSTDDADRDADHRVRGDRRAGQVEVQVAQGPRRRLQARPGLDPLGGRLGGRHRPAAGRASSRGRSAPTPRRPSTSRTPAAARRTRRSSPARSTPASPGCRSSSTRSRRARCALLAVSSPVDTEIGGKQAADDQGPGHRPRADQLARARRAARDLRRRARRGSPGGSRRCSRRRSGRRTSSATTGRRSSRPAPSSTTSWRPSRSACRASSGTLRDRQVIGARGFGGVLLAASASILIARHLDRRAATAGRRAGRGSLRWSSRAC